MLHGLGCWRRRGERSRHDADAVLDRVLDTALARLDPAREAGARLVREDLCELRECGRVAS